MSNGGNCFWTYYMDIFCVKLKKTDFLKCENFLHKCFSSRKI